jgi:hypothetical protein
MVAGFLSSNIDAQKVLEIPLAEGIKIEQVIDGNLSKWIEENFDALNYEAEDIMRETGIPSFKKEDFDLINLHKCSIKDKGIALIASFREDGYTGSFGFVIFKTSEGLTRTILVKGSFDRNSLYYYDLNSGERLELLKVGEGISASITPLNFGYTYRKRNGCAQATINCINNLYNNQNSAVSFWTLVETHFLPATIYGFVALCLLQQCY